jgi:hypothetical protein
MSLKSADDTVNNRKLKTLGVNDSFDVLNNNATDFNYFSNTSSI